MFTKNRRPLSILILSIALTQPGFAEALPSETKTVDAESRSLARDDEHSGILQLQFSNDVFFSADEHFTNVFSLFWQPKLQKRWEDTYLPETTAKLASKLPLLNSPGTHKRLGFALIHLIATPEDLIAEELIEDDLPYSGFLGGFLQLSSSNDLELSVVQLTLGIVGRSSLGEPIQQEAHRLVGTDIPRGWRHQLNDELVVNLDLYHGQRLINRLETGLWGAQFDLDWRVGAGVGNLLSYGSVGIGMRLGWNLIPGWELAPAENRTVANNFHDYRSSPKYSFYFYSILESFAVAHSIFIDGNTFRDSHSVDGLPLQSKLAYGAVFKASRWLLRVSFISGTKLFRSSQTDLEQTGIIDIGYIF